MQSLLQTLARAVVGPRAKATDNSKSGLYNWSVAGGAGGVTADKALQLSAVWACVRLISETIATLPLNLYKNLPDGGREADKTLQLANILRKSPNANMTAVNFIEALVASLLFQGNSFCEIKRVGEQIVALDLLIPQNVKINKGEVSYKVPNSSDTRTIPLKNIWHIPAFSLDGITGLSPIRYGAIVMGAALSADEAASSTFKHGLLPTVAFTVDRVITEEQRASYKKYAAEVSGALNAGKSPVLERGMDAKTIGINPSDAQLLESRGWGVEEICRFFRVPPHLVGYTEKSTSWGSGIEQQMINFLTFTLSPWLKRIEASINKFLLTPEQQQTHYAEFSLEGLLRADSAARAEFYSKMTQNGIYTRDECRARENLPKRGGKADELTVQTNLAPIDDLGVTNDGHTAKAALNTWLNQPD